MKKDRLVNVRFLSIVFIGLMMGIIVGWLFLLCKVHFLVCLLIFVLVILLSVLLYFYAKKNEFKNSLFRARKNVSFILKCSAIGLVISFIAGFVLILNPLFKCVNIKEYTNDVVVAGVVSDYIKKDETYVSFVVDKVLIVNGEEEKNIDSKIVVYSSSNLHVSLGDKITFSGKLEKYEFDVNIDFKNLIDGYGYSTFVNANDIVLVSGSASVRDSIKTATRDMLLQNMSEDNANICMAFLFGDTNNLPSEIRDDFSYAGISHVLAVSGLHVSVLVGLVWFLLKKIKCNKYVKLMVFVSILLFYAYLCSFSYSVCRACLMAMVLAVAKTFYFEYDRLSSLSLAGIIILVFSPLALFSVSFQLSFLSILSIITFAPSIKMIFDKIKCPQFLGDVLSVSISLNIVTLPILMNNFEKVSFLGILCNIFVLPLFSCVYILLFVCMMLGLIIKPLSVLLFVPNLFLHLIKVLVDYVCAIPFGIIRAFNVGYLLLFLIVVFVLTLHFLMTKHYFKPVILSVVLFATIILFVVSSIPKNYKDNLIFVRQNDSNVVFYADQTSVTLIGSDVTESNLLYMCKDLKVRNIDNIIAYDLKLNELENFNKILKEFDVKNVYIKDTYIGYDEIFIDGINYFPLQSKMIFGKLNVGVITKDTEIVGLSLNTNLRNYMLVRSENSKSQSNALKSVLGEFDCVLSLSDSLWEDTTTFAGDIILFDKIKDVIIINI